MLNNSGSVGIELDANSYRAAGSLTTENLKTAFFTHGAERYGKKRCRTDENQVILTRVWLVNTPE
jgi:hypothetical protein